MSTKALEQVLKQASSWDCVDGVTDGPCAHCAVIAARKELEAFRKAAKDLTRLNLGDGVYEVRNRPHVLSETPSGNSWLHPDVKAWSDAAVLLAAISKESP